MNIQLTWALDATDASTGARPVCPPEAALKRLLDAMEVGFHEYHMCFFEDSLKINSHWPARVQDPPLALDSDSAQTDAAWAKARWLSCASHETAPHEVHHTW